MAKSNKNLLEELLEKMNEQFAGVNEQFAGVNDRLSALETLESSMNEQFARVNEQLSAQKKDTEELQDKFRERSYADAASKSGITLSARTEIRDFQSDRIAQRMFGGQGESISPWDPR